MQLGLFADQIPGESARRNGVANKLGAEDRRFHDWYRFVLSFPPHLVRDYMNRFDLTTNKTLLDPFCGTGTTLVEAKLHGISSIGIEANPMAFFASTVKTKWEIDADELTAHARIVARKANNSISAAVDAPLRTLPDEAFSILLKDSISPIPLHKSLLLLDQINENATPSLQEHELLAFAKSLVCSCSNLHFGPEVGVKRTKRPDAHVVECWLAEVDRIACDLRSVKCKKTPVTIHHADSRELAKFIKPASIDAVFTSPPYPNEKDYTRTTRLESVLLGFMNDKKDLRSQKSALLRSNTRNVFKGDDDDVWVAQFPGIQAIAKEIEDKRIALGKTSGFERLYSRVTTLYFGGMARHLSELRPCLRSGAKLGYVVGDQASYFQVMIRTGQLLADIAQSLGYKVLGTDLFRTRLSTATRNQIREEVLLLQWP